jgi:hypothetical protein
MRTDIIGYIIALLTFVIGLIVSYYFYIKSIKVKEPVYAISSINLVSDYKSDYPNLNVSYKKRRVENLTLSKILFYNRGAETINRIDIETINHIKVVVKAGIKILDASILLTNNLSNQFSVDIDRRENCVLLNFDYIDQNQGAVLQVVHTGRSSGDINVTGDIKGAKSIMRIKRPNPRESKVLSLLDFIMRSRRNTKIMWLLLLCFVGIIDILTFWFIFSPDTYQILGLDKLMYFRYNPPPVGSLILTFLTNVLFFILALPFLKREIPLPPGLDIYRNRDEW